MLVPDIICYMRCYTHYKPDVRCGSAISDTLCVTEAAGRSDKLPALKCQAQDENVVNENSWFVKKSRYKFRIILILSD